jgi:hypothetical protein
VPPVDGRTGRQLEGVPLRCRIPTVQAEVRLVKQATPAGGGTGRPTGSSASMAWYPSPPVNAEHFLAFVRIAAALIGYGRLTA